MREVLTVALAVAAVTVAGCAPQPQAPTASGVCWHMTIPKKGAPTFTKIADKVPHLETCMAYLEATRQQFLRMGGSHYELYGAYQGRFIWVLRDGIYASQQYTGPRYIALVRTGDGRLTAPGAAPPPQ